MKYLINGNKNEKKNKQNWKKNNNSSKKRKEHGQVRKYLKKDLINVEQKKILKNNQMKITNIIKIGENNKNNNNYMKNN